MRMRRRLRYLVPLLAAGLVAAGCSADEGGGSGDDPAPGEFPRDETVFTSGTEWGAPSNWNPVHGGGQATGVRGLQFETLFIFDPWNVELEPWLAESGEWVGDDVYEVTLREGIEWHDGTALTSEDVVFTVELGQIPEVPYSNVWDWLASVEAVDELTTRFTFSDPRVGEWENFIYANQIVPKHLFENVPDGEIMSWDNADDPIGSGAYSYHSHTDSRMVWERNEQWWGIEHLGLEMSPRYVIDLVNPSNEVALGLISRGNLDISNNFLPGIQQLVEGDFNITTFHDGPPYMLPANTAMLVPNNTTEPTSDPEFRRALAHAIDVNTIVEGVYGNIVQAANPTGLLPVWDRFVDQSVVSEHGFGYDPERARDLLAAAGYEDQNGDGFVQLPNGDDIALTLETPAGWTDWNESAEVIAEGAREVGINVTPVTPAQADVEERRDAGDYDLQINNWTDLDNTPWTYYDYVFRQPVQELQANANFHRYENEQAWELVQQVGRTSVEDPAIQEPLSQLQEIHMTDLPVIPMWYNGLWSQVNNDTWTNWPDAEGEPYPTTWSNFWEKGAIYWLAQIEPAG